MTNIILENKIFAKGAKAIIEFANIIIAPTKTEIPTEGNMSLHCSHRQ